MEITKTEDSSGAAAAAPTHASSALVHSPTARSMEQHQPSACSPAADVIDVSRWSDGVLHGFRELSLEELRLLTVKLHPSHRVKVLNLSGIKLTSDSIRKLAEPLGKLMALQEINFFDNAITSEGAVVVAEPLGKLTSLRELNLGGVCAIVGLLRD